MGNDPAAAAATEAAATRKKRKETYPIIIFFGRESEPRAVITLMRNASGARSEPTRAKCIRHFALLWDVDIIVADGNAEIVCDAA